MVHTTITVPIKAFIAYLKIAGYAAKNLGATPNDFRHNARGKTFRIAHSVWDNLNHKRRQEMLDACRSDGYMLILT